LPPMLAASPSLTFSRDVTCVTARGSFRRIRHEIVISP
jgi:hypothetical protein